ncbi:MAG: DUF4150 domain-containing protein [Deltaproteobacteria bacterium]|jgi:uncharacterized Zn-binding protein involved in type VI secretion|nr:DUF4150 domain-containing protein [Deltaproteobacteria bacterium]
MFGLTVKGGMAQSLAPDVCNTPAPPAGPVPIPYVNMFQLSQTDPSTASQKVFFDGAQVVNVQSEVPLSQGDEPGTAGGIISGKFIGPGTISPASGSQKVLIEGKQAVAMGAMTFHNGKAAFNTTGICPLAAQAKVMVC